MLSPRCGFCWELIDKERAQGRIPTRVSYRIFGWGGETRWAIKAPPPRPDPNEVMYAYINEIIDVFKKREELPVITFFTSVVVYTYTIVTHVLPLINLGLWLGGNSRVPPLCMKPSPQLHM